MATALGMVALGAAAVAAFGLPSGSSLQLAAAGSWRALGPAPVLHDPYAGNESGRVTSIVVAPNGTIYAGSASGGVWSSSTGGKSWKPLTDNQPDLAIGALALDPSNPSVIYAGTGENDDCGDCFYSMGVLKSTNAGRTWSLLGRGTFYGHYLSNIVVDPQDPSRVLAAGDLGVMLSSDGGRRWRKVLRGPTTDLVAEPGKPQVLLAGVEGVGIERSLNGGQTWRRLAGGLPGRRSLIGRIAIAVAPSDPSTIYTAYAGLRAGCQDCLLGLYVSHNAGATWTKLKVPDYFREPGKPVAAQGDYDNVLAVSPTNPNVLYAGGVNLLATRNGGATWTNLTNQYYLHVDQHALTFAHGTLYIGNDGGVYALGPRGTMHDLNTNLMISQVYQGVTISANGQFLVAGMQDNGTALYYAPTRKWTALVDGDGNYNLFLPGSYPTLLSEVDGQLERSTDIGADWTLSRVPGTAAGPIAFDPVSPGTVLFGEGNLWSSTSGGKRFARITRVRPGSGPLSAIAVAPSNPEVVYAGWSDGLLEMSQNGGRTWRDIGPADWPTGCPPGPGAVADIYVTGISVSPQDPYRAFVSLAYSYPQSLPDCPFVMETPASNTSWPAWVNIANTLPNYAVNDVLMGSSGLYAATGRGIYYSPAGTARWHKLGRGLPNVEVTGLTPSQGSVYAATYGRGVWELPARAVRQRTTR